MSATRRLLAAAAVSAVGTLVFAVPAWAGAGQISSPSDGATSSQPVTVTGSVTLAGSIDSFSLNATDSRGHSAVFSASCATPSPSFTCSNNGSQATFTWSPQLAYNGFYTVQGTANHQAGGLLGRDDSAAIGPSRFGLAVPPAVPGNVKVSINSSTRWVTITWDANSEPDLMDYYVIRTDSSGASVAFDVPKGSGSPVRFTDTDVANGSGGDYSYSVVAERQGATKPVQSKTSTKAYASVPARTTTTTDSSSSGASSSGATVTTAGGSPSSSGAAAGSTATTSGSSVKPTGVATAAPRPVPTPRNGSIDLSTFRNVTPATTPAPPPVTEPDPGYQATLPYKADAAPSTTEQTEPPTTAAPKPRIESTMRTTIVTTDDNKRTMLIFVAGALVLLMLSMHLRWLLRTAEPKSLV